MEYKRSGLVPLLCLVGLALLTVILILHGRDLRTGPEKAVSLDSGAREFPALSEQYRQLDARLSRLEMLLGAGQHPLTDTAQATLPVDPALEREKQQADSAEWQARYQQLFASDARAADSRKWEASIALAFSDPNVADLPEQPTTRSSQCRTRLCLITATFPPDTDGSDWATGMAMALADGFTNSRTASVTLPSGETSLSIYAFKKGSDEGLLEQGL